MAKRPDTLDTTILAIELLRRIPRRRKVTAAELHEQLAASGLNRDIRTIQRLLESLSQHFDIERDDRAKPYGYRWKSQSMGLSIPGMSEQESLLLTLAEQHLRNLLPAKLMRSMDGFFQQARQTMCSTSAERPEREWLNKVRVVAVSQPLLAPSIAAGVFEAVSNALYGNFLLELDYRNASGQQRQASVMPLGIAQQGPRLYLVCRFQGFFDTRSLALHRISKARTTSLTFPRPKDFNLTTFDDEGRFGFGEGKKISLEFKIRKERGLHLTESPLSSDQKVKELPDHYEIKATVIDSQMLDWWLHSFADAIWDIKRRTK